MPKVVLKELKEESVSEYFSFDISETFDTDIHKILEIGEVSEYDHYDLRYLFFGDANQKLNRNYGFKESAWISFDEMGGKVVQNTSIMRMLNKSLSWLI